MKPKVGEKAPDFTARAVHAEGEDSVSLQSLAGQRFVLYFYPKDHTPGCTIQACSLREKWGEFEGKVKVFGVSGDDAESHLGFIKKRRLPFGLIADTDKDLAKAFGVWVEKSIFGRKFMSMERSSFLIGRSGLIEAVLEKVSPISHTAKLLAVIK